MKMLFDIDEATLHKHSESPLYFATYVGYSTLPLNSYHISSRLILIDYQKRAVNSLFEIASEFKTNIDPAQF